MASKSITRRMTHAVVKIADDRWLTLAIGIEGYPTRAAAERRRRTLDRHRASTPCTQCGRRNFGTRDRCKAPAACARRARQQQRETKQHSTSLP